MQPQIEHVDITWSPQYNLPATRTNKRRALSLQEMKLDGWFLILHIILETSCIMWFMHKFNMSFVFHFYTLGLMSWIWINSSIERVKFESPSKMKHIWGLQSWTLVPTFVPCWQWASLPWLEALLLACHPMGPLGSQGGKEALDGTYKVEDA